MDSLTDRPADPLLERSTADTGTVPDLPRPIPGWIASSRPQTPDHAAFSAGAALALLQVAVSEIGVPQALLRDRLALRAAEACLVAAGRPERAGDLRDAVCLARPGDHPGPAGAVFVTWRAAAGRPLTPSALAGVLPAALSDRVAGWLGTARGGTGAGAGGMGGAGDPVARAAAVLEAVLAAAPREVVAARILADAVLSRALGHARLLPLLGPGLSARNLSLSGDALRLACHQAVAVSAVSAVRLAGDLAMRAARLRAVAPKLRARGAAAAVELFLARDALAPAQALSGPGGPLGERAARRLCDRLVALGAVRELTGRATSRLYGL